MTVHALAVYPLTLLIPRTRIVTGELQRGANLPQRFCSKTPRRRRHVTPLVQVTSLPGLGTLLKLY